MNKNLTILVVGAIVLLLFVVYLVTQNTSAQSESSVKPNVVLIYLDDFPDYTKSLGGHPQAKTPYIDNFLKAPLTTNFINAHVPSPVCNSNRASVLSGLSPKTLNIYSNSEKGGLRGSFSARPNARTLINYLDSLGYYTFGVGKITHASQMADEFDEYYSNTHPTVSGDFSRGLRDRYAVSRADLNLSGLANRGIDFGAPDLGEEKFPDYKVADIAIDFLKSRSATETRPFFLGVGLHQTHLNWYCPQKYYDLVTSSTSRVHVPRAITGDLDDLSPKTREQHNGRIGNHYNVVNNAGKMKEATHSLLACVSFVDAMVGRVVREIENGPHKNNTLVIIQSDHGYHMGEKFRIGKNTLWNDSTKVVFGVRLPKSIFGNRSIVKTSAAPVSTGSTFETVQHVLGYAGSRVPQDYVSVLNIMDARSKVENYPTDIAIYSFNGAAKVSSGYKYIKRDDGSEEFYNLNSDPNEIHNLVKNSGYATILSRHRDRFESLGFDKSERNKSASISADESDEDCSEVLQNCSK